MIGAEQEGTVDGIVLMYGCCVGWLVALLGVGGPSRLPPAGNAQVISVISHQSPSPVA